MDNQAQPKNMPSYLMPALCLLLGLGIGFVVADQLANQQQANLEKSIKINQLITEDQKRTIEQQKQRIEELEDQPRYAEHNETRQTPPSNTPIRLHTVERPSSKPNCPASGDSTALVQAQQQITELQKQINNRAQQCLSTRLPPEALNKVYNPPQKQP